MEIFNNNSQRTSCAHPDTPSRGIAGAWRPHPAAQITLWVFLTVLATALHGYGLLMLGAAVLGLAMWFCVARLFSLLRRMRWIAISLLVIYAYATPGTPCWALLGALSPVCEGVLDGLMQLTRLLTVLGGLSILLTALPSTRLIGGLYALAYPLRYVGVSRERIAVRLALTLGYAESAMRDAAQDWRGSIAGLSKPAQTGMGSIELQPLPFRLRDWLVVIVAGGLLIGAVW